MKRRILLRLVMGTIMILVLALFLAALSPALPSQDKDADGDFTDKQLDFFRKQVQPILKVNCLKCHGPQSNSKGELNLVSRALVLKGGESGPAVSIDDPAESLLLQAVNHDGLEMPPKKKLPQAQIDILTRWVEMGAPFAPELEQQVVEEKGPPRVTEQAKQFWSFRPLQQPALPRVRNKAWGRSPIDAFILSGLENAGLKPAATAGKAQLLRRAYYDLVGLPPSPQAVADFLADDSGDAFASVVDQLLESPQYGERWARHWLDLVRYAESNSYERDDPKPFVWRYRDYVIQSLNDDKPYDQFMREQVAGDELTQVTPDSMIATGYYRLGIWQDEPVDRVQELYEDLDDIVSTTGQVFLGLTLNCCRCHDHKLDPLPQRDYYRFMAFFHGINRYGIRGGNTVANFSLRELANEEQKRQSQTVIEEHNKKVQQVNEKISELEKPVIEDFQPVEKQDFQDERNKIPLVKKRVGTVIDEQQFQQYVEFKEEQKKLRNFKPPALGQALVITEIGPKPRETFILARGNAHAPGDPVEPGFPEVLSFPDPQIQPPAEGAKTSNRRLALANWLADPTNPLTARVMMNRVWQYHFGRGIVRSTNNFGYQGVAPTHPELLDWLAADFIEGGWKIKRMHRQIMLSNTYRMSSVGDKKGLQKDPTNNLFWRFDMRRLEAEEIRDSVLAVNGSLNPKMYGPSIYPVIPREVLHGQSRPGAGWGNSSPQERARRSIYIHIKRSLVVPMIAAFDGPDPDATCPVRFVTTQPTQALGMLNSEYFNEQARVFAEYLRSRVPEDTSDQVELALSRALQRTPGVEEVRRGVELIETLQQHEGVDEGKALQLYCLLVLNLNEFIYLD
tara:strand:+ start:174 stop:2717 length:2544 start_codon:yes stop_codon:yes gene_type:complete